MFSGGGRAPKAHKQLITAWKHMPGTSMLRSGVVSGRDRGPMSNKDRFSQMPGTGSGHQQTELASAALPPRYVAAATLLWRHDVHVSVPKCLQ